MFRMGQGRLQKYLTLLVAQKIIFTERTKLSSEEFEAIVKAELLAKSDQQFDLLEAFRFGCTNNTICCRGIMMPPTLAQSPLRCLISERVIACCEKTGNLSHKF